MSIALILQISFNIVIGVLLFAFYKRLTQKPEEDPRLSRGLQLLQSKIAILEDLSDRTDKQVDKLIQLMEQKAQEVQKKLKASDDQIKQLELSMSKSREVAGLFEDKIPHQEVIERESSVKYIKAAQMAYNGHTADEICQELDLSKGEAEFIVKVNKEELMFDESMLPEWAKISLKKLNKKNSNYVEDQFAKYDIGFSETKEDIHEMKKLGEAFRKACQNHDDALTLQTQKEASVNLNSSKEESNSNKVSTKLSKFLPVKNIGVQKLEFKVHDKPLNAGQDENPTT
ncbi:MAG: DUF2802 domain-containing protein [Bdellovibrionales bacterium]|nr:DUF2802 domain-containing protein [Bdellovibrionales bacterium]